VAAITTTVIDAKGEIDGGENRFPNVPEAA
jgi:hypothetical protein